MPIYVICDYYVHKTELADLSIFKLILEIFAANIEISFTFRIREFTTSAIPIPCVLTKFPNSQFSLQRICLAIFPVFPVQWVPCHMTNITLHRSNQRPGAYQCFLLDLSEFLPNKILERTEEQDKRRTDQGTVPQLDVEQYEHDYHLKKTEINLDVEQYEHNYHLKKQM